MDRESNGDAEKLSLKHKMDRMGIKFEEHEPKYVRRKDKSGTEGSISRKKSSFGRLSEYGQRQPDDGDDRRQLELASWAVHAVRAGLNAG
ncbi:hypothetical protein AgCh_033667 [Apium graveolens]